MKENDHWNVLYKVSVFYADQKSKMAAPAGHRLTLDHMGNCSNAFIIPGQFGFNCPSGFREEAF
jgi:hypothetical protein